ncbi:MAG: aldo/keto reductase [Ilumatobacter sp.]|uniref:aldo/keto reductase n=1 Tax=Ilumatobacter sp. TaxID=1967498 RepID=UPI00391BA398
MQHVKFGRTGMRVSKLCLGTMTFGTQCDEATSFDILDTAFDAGITFVDTADMYPNGQDGELSGLTEEIIGRWMRERQRRDDVILASKFWAPMGPNPWNRGASRKHIVGALDASLRRLQTDHLDLYQIHFFDSDTHIDETLRALDDSVRAGKVRYVGCSNFAAWQLAKAIGRSEALGISRYESVQPRYNLLFRDIERELLPLCRHDGVAVMAYNPLAGGLLTGKHAAAAGPTVGTRFTLGSASRRYQERYWADDKFEVVEAMRPLAADAGISLAHMAMGWVLSKPDVTTPIVGASSSAQLADAVAAEAAPLDPNLVAELDALTHHYRAVDTPR